MAKLDMYVAMLTDWQSRMNLVGRSTLPLVWDRHIRDSAQLMNLVPGTGYTLPWLDIGAGAGFPGLVLAAMAGVEVHLVESVGKKARFLSAVADSLDLAETVRVENCRIEALRRFEASVITARALVHHWRSCLIGAWDFRQMRRRGCYRRERRLL